MILVLVVDHGLLIEGTATALVPLTHQLFEKKYGTDPNALEGAATPVVPLSTRSWNQVFDWLQNLEQHRPFLETALCTTKP